MDARSQKGMIILVQKKTPIYYNMYNVMSDPQH